MNLDYEFVLTEPAEKLVAHMNTIERGPASGIAQAFLRRDARARTRALDCTKSWPRPAAPSVDDRQGDRRDPLAGAASFLEASSCVYPSGPSAAARSGGNETNMSMSFARKAVFRMLENVRHGALEVICPATRPTSLAKRGTGLRACDRRSRRAFLFASAVGWRRCRRRFLRGWRLVFAGPRRGGAPGRA